MATKLSRYLIAAAAICLHPLALAPAHAASEVSAAHAQPVTSRATSSPPRARNPNRQVCNETRITGSRFQRRICRSEADRAAAEKDEQDTVRNFQTNGYISPPDPGSTGLVGPGPN